MFSNIVGFWGQSQAKDIIPTPPVQKIRKVSFDVTSRVSHESRAEGSGGQANLDKISWKI